MHYLFLCRPLVPTPTNNTPILSTVVTQHPTGHTTDPNSLPDQADPETSENTVGRENDQHSLPSDLMDLSLHLSDDTSSENCDGKVAIFEDFNFSIH